MAPPERVLGPRRRGRLSARLEAARQRAARPHLHGRVLDWGCGARAPLAAVVPADRYVGVDLNPDSVTAAELVAPGHRFEHVDELDPGERFDTVVSLAVIEHVEDQPAFVERLVSHLVPGGVLVLTTPHPRFEWLHTAGAKVGLVSSHASDDHEDLIPADGLLALARGAGLEPRPVERFLLGLNQLLVARRSGSDPTP
jgi:2-polyprenyl-3-methyl-5-hydroxy-6-metoxy-1,4-benzoquinol methylase